MDILEIIIAVLVALGIFEAGKKILFFYLDNTVIKKNLEIREIANRTQEALTWLKLRNFEQSLSTETTAQLYADIAKIEDDDKEWADNIMMLINYPRLIEILHEKGGDKNKDLISFYHRQLHNMAPKLNRKLNRLRYKPIFKFWKFRL